ncbi:MAG TPA: PLP-dependent lyase/thiolase [Candidatus Paceibacterota bacterium]|jgi:threonine dehydratase|nr:PLP-dependent lyase/thiolase [Candidatus Paceibacterota bacterium]
MQTPLEQYSDLAQAIGVTDLYFKREDLSPYGSHKGRSIPVMIEVYRNQGESRFAISSSGNAALAAAIHIQKHNQDKVEKGMREAGGDIIDNSLLQLDIFVGNHISEHKYKKLLAYADDNIRILKKERPLQALTQAMNEGMRSLRQSTDDLALKGYESLAEELSLIKNLGAVFIGTSSGTTAQALAAYFLNNADSKIPQIHIVQTSSCHPLSDGLNSYDGPDEVSVADAITDITAYRKNDLIPLIQKTGGSGWFATNENIEAAVMLTKKHTGVDISANSALSVAGVMQAAYAGHNFDGPVVCLICGE